MDPDAVRQRLDLIHKHRLTLPVVVVAVVVVVNAGVLLHAFLNLSFSLSNTFNQREFK